MGRFLSEDGGVGPKDRRFECRYRKKQNGDAVSDAVYATVRIFVTSSDYAGLSNIDVSFNWFRKEIIKVP